MNIDKLAYPELVSIDGTEYKGRRDMVKGKLLIPYTEAPDVGIGDVISQRAGTREILLKVLDVSFLEDGSLGVGTKHPHMLTLAVENTTAKPHLSSGSAQTFNIGSLSGSNVQVGNANTLSVQISLQEFVEQVAKSGDDEAKLKLKDILNSKAVAAVLGAGVTGLLALL